MGTCRAELLASDSIGRRLAAVDEVLRSIKMLKSKLTFPVLSCVHIPPSVGQKHLVTSPSHENVYAADLLDAFPPAVIYPDVQRINRL